MRPGALGWISIGCSNCAELVIFASELVNGKGFEAVSVGSLPVVAGKSRASNEFVLAMLIQDFLDVDSAK